MKTRSAALFRHRRTMIGASLTAPALTVLALTMIYPMARTLWLSVNSSNTALSGQPDFVGLLNYGRILASRDFQRALFQTLGIVAASGILEAILGLVVAL